MSLEEHLSESIRMAKERIYANAANNHPPSQEMKSTVGGEGRPRIHSNRQSNGQKEEKSAVANAMKILQDRISVLEQENERVKVQGSGGGGQMQEVKELERRVKAKDTEIEGLVKDNQSLNKKNHQLLEEIKRLQEMLEKSQQERSQQQTPIITVNKPTKMDELQDQNIELRGENVRLAEQVQELQQRNALNHQTIERMAKQLQQEKRINLRWIRMHENQLNDHKQNNSVEINHHHQERRTSHKKETPLRGVGIKEMQDKLTRSKAKIASLTQQCKEYQERYRKAQLIAHEIVDNVNQVIPNANSHIKFLASQLSRLDGYNYLRSSSRVRRSRLQQGSPSRSAKRRSLKMSDLNSASKIERSVSGSRRGRVETSSATKSDKKRQISLAQIEKLQLQQQIKDLKRKHRNLTVKNSVEGEESREMVETREALAARMGRLQQLRRLA